MQNDSRSSATGWPWGLVACCASVDGTPSQNRFETEAIDGIGSWLESGDIDAVKKWLTFFLEGRDDWRELLAALHKDIEAARLEELEEKLS